MMPAYGHPLNFTRVGYKSDACRSDARMTVPPYIGSQVILTEKLPDGMRYLQAMQHSRFCLCPAGWGFGARHIT
eukprot:363062-Chlamydomonas_euryale.AAC.7